MVYKTTITNSAIKILTNTMIKDDIEIELFPQESLIFNITQHKYFRPHIKLSITEKKKVLKIFGDKLPILLSTDPVSLFCNFHKGDIVKIIRDNEIVAYRIVR